jgi:hypothetical protein
VLAVVLFLGTVLQYTDTVVVHLGMGMVDLVDRRVVEQVLTVFL